MMAEDPKSKSIARSLGEFVGHIVRGVKTDPAKANRTEVKREVIEEKKEGMVLRRTTIEEIEISPTQEDAPDA
jgi:hypothetical protein